MRDYPEYLDRDPYDDYVAECRADGDTPLPRRLWELECEEDFRAEQEEQNRRCIRKPVR
jgi:hypothetical protein